MQRKLHDLNTMKTLIISFFCVLFSGDILNASTLVIWHNSSGTKLSDFNSVLLSDGPVGNDYDGDIIQLGYYSQATTTDPFAGLWTTLQSSTIGDKGTVFLGPGRYDYLTVIASEDSLQLLGIPLSIRFFDDIAQENATYFNSVSDSSGGWNMIHSSDTRLNLTLSLDSSNLVWQGGSSSAFRTTIPIPEPTGLSLAAGGVLFLMRKRRGGPLG